VKFTFSPKTNKAPSKGLRRMKKARAIHPGFSVFGGRGIGLKGGLDWGCPHDLKKGGMVKPISNGYITEKALSIICICFFNPLNR
jgi:hypothetical protein